MLHMSSVFPTFVFKTLTAMSEPPSSATKTDVSADFSTNVNGDGDAPQSIPEILNALDQSNSNTTPSSQENIKEQLKEEELPQQPAPSEWETLRIRLRDSPYDPEGWLKLVELAESSGEIDQIKETYEALLEAYPNTVCQSFVSPNLNKFSDRPRLT